MAVAGRGGFLPPAGVSRSRREAWDPRGRGIAIDGSSDIRACLFLGTRQLAQVERGGEPAGCLLVSRVQPGANCTHEGTNRRAGTLFGRACPADLESKKACEAACGAERPSETSEQPIRETFEESRSRSLRSPAEDSARNGAFAREGQKERERERERALKKRSLGSGWPAGPRGRGSYVSVDTCPSAEWREIGPGPA